MYNKKFFCAICLSIILNSSMSLSEVSAVSEESEIINGEQVTPIAFVQNMINEAIDEIIKNDSGVLSEKLADSIENLFDYKRMAISALGGQYARSVSPEKIKEFVKEYKMHLINTYLPKIKFYKDYRISKISNSSNQQGNKKTIHNVYVLMNKKDSSAVSSIDDPTGIHMTYVIMEKSPGNYKIVDIKVQNISFVISQQSEFQEILSRGGFDGLMAEISKANKKHG